MAQNSVFKPPGPPTLGQNKTHFVQTARAKQKRVARATGPDRAGQTAWAVDLRQDERHNSLGP
eukprot:2952147-Lingulodinium_polyedra.AAC.1